MSIPSIERIIEDNHHKFLSVGKKYLPPHEVADVVQEFEIWLWERGLDSFDPAKGTLSNYLFSHLRFRFKDVLSTRRPAPEPIQYHLNIAAPEPVPETLPNDFLQYLTPKQREVAELLAEGYSYTAIGKRLGISKQAVHNRMALLKKQRDLLE